MTEGSKIAADGLTGHGRRAVPACFAPCIDLARAHSCQRELCDALEAVADDLPSRVDRLRCLMIASTLVPLLRECHRFEQETIFPAFVIAVSGSDIVARLEAEHLEDEAAAEDVSEALLAIGHGGAIANPEALGYMLRALFRSVRRHVACERAYVAPTAPEAG